MLNSPSKNKGPVSANYYYKTVSPKGPFITTRTGIKFKGKTDLLGKYQ